MKLNPHFKLRCDILNAYDTLLGSDVSTARVVLRSLVK